MGRLEMSQKYVVDMATETEVRLPENENAVIEVGAGGSQSDETEDDEGKDQPMEDTEENPPGRFFDHFSMEETATYMYWQCSATTGMTEPLSK
jgi:hypothetical protein